MARKEQVKSRRKKPSGVTESIIDAAPSLAWTQAWRAVSLSDIVDEAGVSLGQADIVILSKAVIVSRFMKRIDQHILDGAAVDATESVRDRLFEVLTWRFDALAQHKCAVAAILGGLCAEPAAALAQTSRVLCSVEWILEAARVPSDGRKLVDLMTKSYRATTAPIKKRIVESLDELKVQADKLGT